MVYELMLSSDSWIGLAGQVNFSNPKLLPGNGLLSTCWQIHHECLRIIFNHEILIASVSPCFEMINMKLSIPKSVTKNVRFLTLHISAPEVKDERQMAKLRTSLKKARALQKLKIDIFPLRVNAAARNALVGWTGRHALQKGLAVLKDVRIRGEVKISLAGNHEFSPSTKPATKFELGCLTVLKEIEQAMMADSC